MSDSSQYTHGSHLIVGTMADWDAARHIGYFSGSLRQLPSAYDKLDTNRLTLAHFCVHALDLLGVWEDEARQEQFGLDRLAIIEWIYSLQVHDHEQNTQVGFIGGTFLGSTPSVYQHGHIAMTYTALATLATLGDDLGRVDKKAIIKALESLQLPDGSYQAVAFGSEHDMRFLYCACCISHMLGDWSGINIDKACDYIRSCRSFDGGIALLPVQEGHGGSTFCGVASLVLMNKVDEVLDEEWRAELIHWCVHRQVTGMQGRPNKLEDTCYSYWIGGTLAVLGEDALLDHERLRGYVLSCQTKMGGFSKVLGVHPDVLHSFYSLAYLSLSQKHLESLDLKAVNCTLGIAHERAALFDPLHP